MKKYYLNPNALLGGIVLKEDKVEVVHLSLKANNEVPTYKNDAEIIIFVIEGEVNLILDEEINLKAREMVKVPSNVSHSIKVLKDSQLFIVKVY